MSEYKFLENVEWFSSPSYSLNLTPMGASIVTSLNSCMYVASVNDIPEDIQIDMANNGGNFTNAVRALLLSSIDSMRKPPEDRRLTIGSPISDLWAITNDAFMTGASAAWKKRAASAYRLYALPGGSQEMYAEEGTDRKVGKAILRKILLSKYELNAFHLKGVLEVMRCSAPLLAINVAKEFQDACVNNQVVKYFAKMIQEEEDTIF